MGCDIMIDGTRQFLVDLLDRRMQCDWGGSTDLRVTKTAPVGVDRAGCDAQHDVTSVVGGLG